MIQNIVHEIMKNKFSSVVLKTGLTIVILMSLFVTLIWPETLAADSESSAAAKTSPIVLSPPRRLNTWNDIKDAWVDLKGNSVAAVGSHPEPGNVTGGAAPMVCLVRTKASTPRGTFLVFPGGAYHGLAVMTEGLNAAELLNNQGYDVAIVAYSHGRISNDADSELHVRAKALQDALAAVNLIQENNEKLGLHTRTLGIMGFSAGGHLTARTFHELGTASPFAKIILIYPAYLEIKPYSVAPLGINDPVQPPNGAKAKIFVAIGDKDQPSWVSSSQAYVDAAKIHSHEAEYLLLPGLKHAFNLLQPGDASITAAFQKAIVDFLTKSSD